MKNKYVIVIIIIVNSFFCLKISGQEKEMYSDFLNYYEIQKHFYDSIYVAKNGEMKGTGYTSFLRFIKRWQEVYFNDGDLDSSLTARKSYINTCINNYYPAKSSLNNWIELGPVKDPRYDYYNDVHGRGIGRVNFIEFNPNDEDMVFIGSPTGGLFYSEDYGATWQNGGTDYLPIPGCSDIQIPYGYPDTWFLLTGDGDANFSPTAGVWRTTDGGQNWFPINNMIWIGFPNSLTSGRKLLINPVHGDTLYAAFSSGLYVTTNALANDPNSVQWTNLITQSNLDSWDPDYENNLQIEGNDIYIQDIIYKPESNRKILIASGESVFISNNKGESWQELPGMPAIMDDDTYWDDLFVIRMSADNPDTLFVVKYYKNCGAIDHSGRDVTATLYRYTFSTNNWSPGILLSGDNGIVCGRSESFCVAPTNAATLYRANVDNIYESVDYGNTWHLLPKNYHDDIHWITYAPNNTDIWIGTDGGLNRSSDHGVTWTNLTNGIGISNMHGISTGNIIDDKIVYGGYDVGTSVYFSDEDEWYMIHGGDAFDSSIDDENGIFYITEAGVLMMDTNLTEYGSPSITPPGGLSWFPNFVKDYLNQNILYAANIFYISRSLDRGSLHTWEHISPIADISNTNRIYYNLWNSILHPNYLYALKVNQSTGNDPLGFVLLKSTNCNVTDPTQVSFSELVPQLNNEVYRKWISDLVVDENNPDAFWIVYKGYTNVIPKVIYYDGTNWIDWTDNNLTNLSVCSIAYDFSEKIIYIGTTGGVFWKEKNSNQGWTKLEGLPHVEAIDLDINFCLGKLRAATFGRGLWETDLIKDNNPISISSNTTWDDYKMVFKK